MFRPRIHGLAGLLQFVVGFTLVLLYKLVSPRVALISSLFLVPALSMAASVILFHRFALWAALLPVLISILIAELLLEGCGLFGNLRKIQIIAKTIDGRCVVEHR